MLRAFRQLALVSFVISLPLLSQGAWAEEQRNHAGSIDGEATPADRVLVHTTFDPGHVQAGLVKVAFHLYDKKLKKSLDQEAIEVSHGAPVHVVIYDSALMEYRHVHPTFQNGMWEIEVDLPRNGAYHLWTQGKVKEDGGFWSSATEFTVAEGDSSYQPTAMEEVLSGVDGNSRTTLSQAILTVNDTSMFTLTFDRLDGSFPELSPYLGALAHLMIVDSQGDQLVHAHPMEGYGNSMMVHATFPHAGFYRMWVEFNDGDAHRIVPLWLNVK